MQTLIEPVVRSFDNRTVYRWQLIDTANRIRGAGHELSRAAAHRAAARCKGDQGPDLLLDMLEHRHKHQGVSHPAP